MSATRTEARRENLISAAEKARERRNEAHRAYLLAMDEAIRLREEWYAECRLVDALRSTLSED